MVATCGGKCLVIRSGVRPGHVVRYPFLIAFTSVEGAGLKHAAWRKAANCAFGWFLWMMAFAMCG